MSSLTPAHSSRYRTARRRVPSVDVRLPITTVSRRTVVQHLSSSLCRLSSRRGRRKGKAEGAAARTLVGRRQASTVLLRREAGSHTVHWYTYLVVRLNCARSHAARGGPRTRCGRWLLIWSARKCAEGTEVGRLGATPRLYTSCVRKVSRCLVCVIKLQYVFSAS